MVSTRRRAAASAAAARRRPRGTWSPPPPLLRMALGCCRRVGSDASACVRAREVRSALCSVARPGERCSRGAALLLSLRSSRNRPTPHVLRGSFVRRGPLRLRWPGGEWCWSFCFFSSSRVLPLVCLPRRHLACCLQLSRTAHEASYLSWLATYRATSCDGLFSIRCDPWRTLDT